MTSTKQPFWEESYKRPGTLDTFYGGKPSPDVMLAASQLNPGSEVLDLGCGEGRNAIYLAQLGFNVTAVDISQPGINKLKTVTEQLGLPVSSQVGDMRNFDFQKRYDLIVSHSCLQYIPRSEWLVVINKMKEATAPGGFNIIDIFTDELPEPEDQQGLMVGLFKPGELAQLYKNWKILECRPYKVEHTHPGGPTHRHGRYLQEDNPKLPERGV